jgi:hypothetical protein
VEARPNPTPGLVSPPLSPMVALQNRWYNALVGALTRDPSMFQLVQPSGPMSPTDQALWAYLDVIPPASLTFNRSLPGAGQFFTEYAPMVSQIQFPQTAFEQDIGEQNYRSWSAYLATLSPPPSDNQLPLLFQNWAARNAPSVASAGVAFLSRLNLLDAAQQALAPYQGPNAKPADFTGGYADLIQTLKASSGRNISFDSTRASGDVRNTWTGGIDIGVDGLWRGSGSSSRLSRKFAASNVTVSAQFQAYAQWTAVPGAWYSSSLLNVAYSSQATPPWVANADPSWNDLFGPDGSMLRFIASLAVVDGTNITVTSNALFSTTDQQTILDGAPLGFWPFYAPALDGSVSNLVSFGSSGGMEIEIVTQPGNPLVIGANVLGIAQFLGHLRSIDI